jgi:hypothetical protein
MLMTMLGVAGAAPRDGYSAQVSTVQYPRASLYEGLPVDFIESVDELNPIKSRYHLNAG